MSKNTGTSELINYFDLGVNGDVGIAGSLDINTIANATTDTDTFLVSDTGIIKYRTGAQLLSDIGAQGLLTNPVTGTGTSGTIPVFTGSTTIGNSIIQSNATQVNVVGNGSQLLFDSLGSSKSGGIQYTNDFELLINNSRGVGSAIYLGNVNMDFHTNVSGNPRLRITGGGNILVGTTSDNGAKLQVNGGSTITNSAGGFTASNYLQIEGATANNSNYPGILFKGGTIATTYPNIALSNGGIALVLNQGFSASLPNTSQISLNNGAITLSTGSTLSPRLTVNEVGNVEIGTTGFSSPSGADRFVGVYGAQDCSLILQDAVQLWELYVNDDFYINRGSTNVLSLNRTTGAATFSSSVTTGSTLQANGNAFILPTLIGGGAGGGLYLGVYPDTQYTKQAILVERYVGVLGNYGRGSLHFCNRDTADANQPTLADSRMVITSGGNVGINTNNPDGQLSGTKGLSIVHATNAAVGLSNGANHWLNYLSGTTYRIWNNSVAEVMTLMYNGNVLIGTTTDSGFKLTVNGSLRNGGAGTYWYSGADNTGMYMETVGTTTSTRRLRIQGVNNAGTSYSSILLEAGISEIAFLTADTERMRINSSGNVTISGSGNTLLVSSNNNSLSIGVGFQGVTSGYIGGISSALYGYSTNGGYVLLNSSSAWVPASDIKRKRNFEPYTKGLSAILGLQPKLYNMDFQKDGDEKQVGLVAQEVRDFIPLAYEDNAGFIGLNYNAIIVTMVKAIQEQQQQIQELKNKLS